jgi:hypothetical protein
MVETGNWVTPRKNVERLAIVSECRGVREGHVVFSATLIVTEESYSTKDFRARHGKLPDAFRQAIRRLG